MNYAADARAQKAERRDAESETSAADKAVIRLVDISVVQRLPGSCPYPKGRRMPAAGKKSSTISAATIVIASPKTP